MNELFNKPIFAAVISWVVAQLIKTVYYIIKNKAFNRERILGAGGMPSSHSAAVCSLAVVILRISGVNSVDFALSTVFAMVVMYDASGVRRAAGLHAKELNRLRHIIAEFDGKREEIKDFTDEDENEINKLKEYLGHTPLEVFFGALLGILIGMLIRL